MSGKGDTQRPVNRRRFERNYDGIRWKSKKPGLRTVATYKGTGKDVFIPCPAGLPDHAWIEPMRKSLLRP